MVSLHLVNSSFLRILGEEEDSQRSENSQQHVCEKSSSFFLVGSGDLSFSDEKWLSQARIVLSDGVAGNGLMPRLKFRFST